MDNLYKDKIIQNVLMSAYLKLNHDFHHEFIKDRLENEICFNSNNDPCNLTNDDGINIEIYTSKNADSYSPFEYTVTIAYEDNDGNFNQIFKADYMSGQKFCSVTDEIEPLLIAQLKAEINYKMNMST